MSGAVRPHRAARVRRHAAQRGDLRRREGSHSSGAARKHHVLCARHAERSARNSRRVVTPGAVGRGNQHRHPSDRHLHAARDGAAVRRHERHHGGDRAGHRGDSRARQISHRPWRRALDYRRRRRRDGREAPGLSVLQIDAHADLRDTYMGTRFNHACAMRRVLEYARMRRRWASAACRPKRRRSRPSLPTTIFYDVNMRQDTNWIAKVVESLGETVYITIDVDGMDPAIMPATGTPEPGGLSWYEMLVAAARRHLRSQCGGMRSRRAIAAARRRRAELSLREADLQDSDVSIHVS